MQPPSFQNKTTVMQNQDTLIEQSPHVTPEIYNET